MREHAFRDRTDWPSGPWNGEPDHVEWRDEFTGLPCLAHRNHWGAWCGYVGVTPGHPWHGKDYDACDYVDVHGGLTYADTCQEGPEGEVVCHVPEPGESDDVWWFGFDCGHGFDSAPVMKMRGMDLGGTYKPLGYVQTECAQLAKQLAEVGV